MDYWIASGAFVTNLDPLVPNNTNALTELISNYPPSVMIFVESEDGDTTYNLPSYGGYVNLLASPNWSVQSSLALSQSFLTNVNNHSSVNYDLSNLK